MTVKEYNKFINSLLDTNTKIVGVYIHYYDKITKSIKINCINPPRGVIGEPYINMFGNLIDPNSVFLPFREGDIEINGDNMLFHCSKKIYNSKNITVGYEEYDFSINRKYISHYNIITI